jgi:hypothetical protein
MLILQAQEKKGQTRGGVIRIDGKLLHPYPRGVCERRGGIVPVAMRSDERVWRAGARGGRAERGSGAQAWRAYIGWRWLSFDKARPSWERKRLSRTLENGWLLPFTFIGMTRVLIKWSSRSNGSSC